MRGEGDRRSRSFLQKSLELLLNRMFSADDVCIASAFLFVELVLNPACTYDDATPAIAKATPSNNKSTRKSNYNFSQGGCPANKAFQGEREPANLKSGEGWKSKLVELQ